MTPEPDPDSPGDADLRALFARTAPAPSPTDLAPLRAALRRRPPPPSFPLSSPVPSRKSPMKLALTAVTALCLSVAAAAFWRAEPAVAFADVRAAVAAAETIRCTSVTVSRFRNGAGPEDLARPERFDRHRHIAAGGRRRSEKYQVVVHPGLAVPYEQRPQHESLHEVCVTDPAAGLTRIVNHAHRRVDIWLFSEQVWRDDLYAAQFAFLRHLPEEGVTPIEPRRIDGVDAPGFLVPGFPGWVDTEFTARVWVHPDTRLPLRLESVAPERELPGGQEPYITFADFEFDRPVPPETFAIDIPPGYSLDLEWRARSAARHREWLRERAERDAAKSETKD